MLSETYIKSEIEAIGGQWDIAVVALSERREPPYKKHLPCRYLSDPGQIREAINEFQPHVLHSHWLTLTTLVAGLARDTNIPFTIRSHSFDTIWEEERNSFWTRLLKLGQVRVPAHIQSAVPLINDDLCLGILAFPYSRPRLEKAGIRSGKIHDCYPVVNYWRFYDPSPNGSDVMNVGACLPKKKTENFIELAKLVPNRKFNLYAMAALGHRKERIAQLNQDLGSPVTMMPPVQPEDMPREYKKHEWLVQTACPRMRAVGWSLSIAEAQASGVGVCMPNIHPNMRDYVGPASFLYNSISQVVDIIKKPFSKELRQLGFEHAKKSDIFQHKVILTNLWQKAIATQSAD